MPSSHAGRPAQTDSNADNWRYIQLVAGEDAIAVLRSQHEDASSLFATISEEKSRHSYAPGKWSIRTLLNHISDCERTFAYRAFWFSRSFDQHLPSIDQDVAAAHAGADEVDWLAHVEEFNRVRLSTISLFENMPAAGWDRKGIASNHPITVRALAFLIAGHTAHHLTILRARYL
jgi:hypothetical protein